MAVARPVAVIVSVVGKAYVRHENGELVELKAGDIVLEGQVVITSADGRVDLDFGGGSPFSLQPNQTVQMTAELTESLQPTIEESALQEDSFDQIVQALENGGDLDAVLEAPAAGTTGSGDSGNSFVRLTNIIEELDPSEILTSQAVAEEIVVDDPFQTDDLLGDDGAGDAVAADTGTQADTTAPVITVNAPDLTNDNTPTITGTTDAPDGAIVTVVVTDVDGGTQTITAVVDGGGVYAIDVPDALPEGEYSVAATVADDAGNVGNASDISNIVDQLPTVSINDTADGADSTPSWSGSSSNTDGDLTLTVNSVEYSVSPAANGDWSFTLPESAALADGSYTVTIDGSDAQGNDASQDSDDVEIDVNDAPVAVVDSDSVAEDGSVVIDVVGNDSDLDGTIDPTTVTITSAPSNGSVTVDPATGAVTYTPAANYHGSDSFAYTVQDDDGATSNAATVSLSVTDVNDAPVAVVDSDSVAEDGSVVIDVVGNDSDLDGTIDPTTVTITSAPSNGSVSVDPATGAVTYTPAANYHGSDSFAYTVQDDDGATSNAATVSLSVTDVNDAPVAEDLVLATTEDTPITVTLQATDEDSTVVSFTIDTVPTDGTLYTTYVAEGDPANVVYGEGNSIAAINGEAILTFVPDAHESGSDAYGGSEVGDQKADYVSFDYTATDGDITSTPATITIDVTAVADAPNLTVTASDFDYTTQIEEFGDVGGHTTSADVATLTEGIWHTDNPNGKLEIGQEGTYLGNGVTNNNVIELERNPGDASNLYTEISAEAGETYQLSFKFSPRSGHVNDSTIYVKLTDTENNVETLLTLESNIVGLQDYSLAIPVSETGTYRLEFVSEDQNSTGGVLDDIHLEQLDNSGLEGVPVQLSAISAGLVDDDGSENLALMLTGIPAGATISDGSNSYTAPDSAEGSVNITTGWDLDSLTINVPNVDATTDFTLNVEATATESSTGESATTTLPIEVTIYNGPDVVSVSSDTDEVYESAMSEGTASSSMADVASGNIFDNDSLTVGTTLSNITIDDGTTDTSVVGEITVVTAEGNTLVVDTATGAYTYTLVNAVDHLVVEEIPGTVIAENYPDSLINGNNSTSEIYDFGIGHANQTVTIAVTVDVNDNWDVENTIWTTADNFTATATGSNSVSRTISNDGTITLDVQLDDAGQVTVEFSNDANHGNERVVLSNFSITGSDNAVHDVSTDEVIDSFTYTVTDAVGVESSSTLDVTIHDDSPVVDNQSSVSLSLAESVDTNIVLTLDVSGSMNTNVDGGTRLQVSIAALKNTINAYDDQGDVNVNLTLFNGGAVNLGWMTATEATDYLDLLTMNSSNYILYDGNSIAGLTSVMTNYEDAIDETVSGYDVTTPPAADKTVAYFISDGSPTEENNEGGDVSYNVGSDSESGWLDTPYATAWENFIDNNGILLEVIGVGSNLSTDYLNQVQVIDGKDAVIVTDEATLSDTLLSTVVTVEGSLYGADGEAGISFGADGGHILELTYDSVTYTYDSDNPVQTIILSEGEIELNFETGGYIYTPTASSGTDLTEHFLISITDGDDDSTLDQDLSLNIDYIQTITGTDSGEILAGTAGSDIIIGGEGDDTLSGLAGDDVFKWELNDGGDEGNPAVDTITDFDQQGNDVLDLSDLLVGESEAADNLDNYLHFEQSGDDTVVHVSSTGGFDGGYDSTAEDQTITLTDVDLDSLTVDSSTDATIIADMITNGKLITD